VGRSFLLSAAARTLSLKAIYAEGEEAAYRRFCALRWPETDGAPICPGCGCADVYDLATRRRFKCAACHRQFSVKRWSRFPRQFGGSATLDLFRLRRQSDPLVASMGFEGCSSAESRMGSLRVVVGHPLADPGPRLGAGLEGVEVHALVLQ